MSKPTTLKINIAPNLYLNAQQEADRIGISVQDFIRTLLATYFAKSESIQSVSRDAQLLQQAYTDLENGDYTEVSTPEELDTFLQSL